jgi:hypothetical protein
LREILMSRDSTPAQRGAARAELAKMISSPAAKNPAAPGEGKPARAAIQPYPSIPSVQLKSPQPVRPVDPADVAKVEVVAPSRAIVNPTTGSVIAPTGHSMIDLRTGSVLQETPSGYIDPRNGRLIPK